MRTGLRLGSVLITGALLLAVAGCAGGSDAAAPSSAGPSIEPSPGVPDPTASPTGPATGAPSVAPADARVALTITYTKEPGADPRTWTLTCDPTGGSHPDPAGACAVLAKAGLTPFKTPDPTQACTEVYGGPQTATVVGVIGGSAVNALLSRTNGCQIARWQALAGLFPQN